jgi:hypothetical protein
MFLSRFSVKNYKCLGDIDIPLTPIHVLIGQNDAGKTSLLEALAAFFESGDKPVVEIFPGPWEGRELVHHKSPEPLICFRGDWTQATEGQPGAQPAVRYGFTIEFASRGNVRACHVCGPDWVGAGTTTQPVWNVTNSDITGLHNARRRAATGDPKTWPDSQAGWNFATAQTYSFDPRTMALPAAIDPRRRFCLHRNGFGLATLLDDILGHSRDLYSRLESEFCKYFPQFTGVRLAVEDAVQRTETPGGGVRMEAAGGKGIHFATAGGTVRAQQASSGAVLFLGFLAIAHLPEPPPLLLIEEPENGIYPLRLRQVIELLKRGVAAKDGPQIIMTTHSPYVLSAFKPEEVTFLSRPPEDPDAPVRARPLRDAPNIEERLAGGEFYLGELWYNLSEEELFGGA